MDRKETVKSKTAALAVPTPESVIDTLWTPTPRLGGNMNLSGVKVDVAPVERVAVALPVDRAIAGLKALRAVPLTVISAAVMSAEALKSVRSTVTVEPGVDVVDLGVAPAFCTNAVELTLLIPALSVIQTYPPALVPAPKRIEPVKTPSASIVPEPLSATPPAPVVGATEFCGLRRILQSAQVALKPPPVTVTVAPRAAVVGVNFVNRVISVIDDSIAVAAVRSVEEWTFNVPVPVVTLV